MFLIDEIIPPTRSASDDRWEKRDKYQNEYGAFRGNNELPISRPLETSHGRLWSSRGNIKCIEDFRVHDGSPVSEIELRFPALTFFVRRRFQDTPEDWDELKIHFKISE